MDSPPLPEHEPPPRTAAWSSNLVLIAVAAVLFARLFWSFAHPAPVPRPERIGLLQDGKPRDGSGLLRGGLALPSPWELARAPVVSRMDYPLGSEAGALTYNARPFREADHLGDDLNGIGGQNSDLGDPVRAAADGLAIHAADAGGGWGKVVILQHRDTDGNFFQTFYGHLERIDVEVGQIVPRGHILGTVGTANSQYFAHLHFEVRRGFHLDLGAGYSPLPLNRENPEGRLRSGAREEPSRLHPSPGEVAGNPVAAEARPARP